MHGKERMKKGPAIQENELDAALNAVFLEMYSAREDGNIAGFLLDRDYPVEIDAKKEAAVIARLNRKPGGNRNFLLSILALLLAGLIIFFLVSGPGEKAQPPANLPVKPKSAFTGSESQ